MFIGTIDNLKSYLHQPILIEVLKYLKTTDFSKKETGEYQLDDKEIKVIIDRYETKKSEEAKPETHIKNIDFQFIVEGEESLGWCPLSPDLEIAEEYDEKNDVTFYKKLVPESCVILTKGNFVVLYPDDVHSPCVSIDENEPSKVTKVILKIPVNLLQ